MVTIVIEHYIIKKIYFIWYTDTLMKNLLNFENEFIGKKWEGRGCESKKIFFVWRKLKIETKMRKGKYVSKIKPVII